MSKRINGKAKLSARLPAEDCKRCADDVAALRAAGAKPASVKDAV